jgi:hypothetical protein
MESLQVRPSTPDLVIGKDIHATLLPLQTTSTHTEVPVANTFAVDDL